MPILENEPIKPSNFNSQPEIVKAFDELKRLRLLESYLAAQIKDIRVKEGEIGAYIDDKRHIWEGWPTTDLPPRYTPKANRGMASRIAGIIIHKLGHSQFPP